jgi:hypothetical protein
MLYETLKCPQIAPLCISSKKIPDPLPLSRIMACTLLSLNYAPVKGSSLRVPVCLHVLKNELFKDE